MTTTPAHKIEVYQDTQQEWRWRARAANGRIIADSGEGYEDRDDAVYMARNLFPNISTTIEEKNK